jgi:outer membrane protein assembly factor BamB
MEKANEELTVFSPLFVEDRVVYIHVQTKKHGSRLYALNTQSGAEIWHYPPLSGN